VTNESSISDNEEIQAMGLGDEQPGLEPWSVMICSSNSSRSPNEGDGTLEGIVQHQVGVDGEVLR
jgi:hypothetical protein